MPVSMTETSRGEVSRREGWEIALHNWATEMIGRPFVLGQTNCAMLVAGALDVIYGTRLLERFKDVAPNESAEIEESQSRRTLREIEGLGLRRVTKFYEQTGDVILGYRDPFERCGVYLGGNRVLTSNRVRGVCVADLDLFFRSYKARGFRWV